MKKVIAIFIILLILVGCNKADRNSTDSLVITQENEKAILNYLDANTNYIITPSIGGKIYNAFKVLGTDIDRIYLWVLKGEYIVKESELVLGSGVSIPIVLYISNNENGMEIISHKFPEGDASEYIRNIKKLFPENIQNKMQNNEDIKKLIENIKKRVVDDNDIIVIKENLNKDIEIDKTDYLTGEIITDGIYGNSTVYNLYFVPDKETRKLIYNDYPVEIGESISLEF